MFVVEISMSKNSRSQKIQVGDHRKFQPKLNWALELSSFPSRKKLMKELVSFLGGKKSGALNQGTSLIKLGVGRQEVRCPWLDNFTQNFACRQGKCGLLQYIQ